MIGPATNAWDWRDETLSITRTLAEGGQQTCSFKGLPLLCEREKKKKKLFAIVGDSRSILVSFHFFHLFFFIPFPFGPNVITVSAKHYRRTFDQPRRTEE